MPFTSIPILRTPRLTLRPLTVEDSEAVYRMIAISRDSFSRWFTWAGAGTLDSVKDYHQQVVEAMTVGNAWQFVVLTQAQSLIGRVGLSQIDPVSVSAELGYMLRTDFEKRGLMTEAVQGLLAYAFGPGGLHRVTAYADVDNLPSHRVLERLGFRREGTIRHMAHHPTHGWRDQHVYGLLEGELRG